MIPSKTSLSSSDSTHNLKRTLILVVKFHAFYPSYLGTHQLFHGAFELIFRKLAKSPKTLPWFHVSGLCSFASFTHLDLHDSFSLENHFILSLRMIRICAYPREKSPQELCASIYGKNFGSNWIPIVTWNLCPWQTDQLTWPILLTSCLFPRKGDERNTCPLGVCQGKRWWSVVWW